MTALALAADAELVAMTYLRGVLAARAEPYAAGVAVSTKLPPATSPGRHVRVRRVGGVPYSVVQDSPRLDFQVWYETGSVSDEQSRTDLALLVWGLAWSIRGQVVVLPSGLAVTCYRVLDVMGPTAMPDPADDTRTITALTVEIGMRIRAA